MSKPAHKNTEHPPGQINFDRYAWQKQPITPPKKLTFDEWWNTVRQEPGLGRMSLMETYKFIWKAAQENK